MINQTYQRKKVLEVTVHYKLINQNQDAMQVVWPTLFRDVRVKSRENPCFALEELKKQFFVKHPHPFQEFKEFSFAPIYALSILETDSDKSADSANTKSEFLDEKTLDFLESPLKSRDSRNWIAQYCSDRLGEVKDFGNIKTACYPEECSDLRRGEYISFEIMKEYNAAHAKDMRFINKEKLFIVYEHFLKGKFSDALHNAHRNHILVAQGEYIAARKSQADLDMLVRKLNLYPGEYTYGEFTDRNYVKLYQELYEKKNQTIETKEILGV